MNVQALQLVDLNWSILQRKASADIELSVGTKTRYGSEIKSAKLKGKVSGVRRLLREFEDAGGDEDDFEDPIDWDAISKN